MNGWEDSILTICHLQFSLRKQLTLRYANSGFPAKWPQRNEHINLSLITYNYPDLGRAPDRLEICLIQSLQKHHQDLTSDASSVWNFCTSFSDVISWGNHRWDCKVSAFFLGCLYWSQQNMLSIIIYCTLIASSLIPTTWSHRSSSGYSRSFVHCLQSSPHLCLATNCLENNLTSFPLNQYKQNEKLSTFIIIQCHVTTGDMQQDKYKVTFEHTRTLSKACTHVQSSFYHDWKYIGWMSAVKCDLQP